MLLNNLSKKVKENLKPLSDSQMILVSALQEHMENFFSMNEEELLNLKEDIHENGLNTKLLVRKLPESHELYSTEQPYQILVGHRRFRGVRALDWEYVECKVIECQDVDAEKVLITDNLMARKITPVEQLQAIDRLKQLFKKEKEEKKLPGRIRKLISEEIGLKESQVGRYEKILKNGAEDTIKAVKEGKLSIAAAYELCNLSVDDQESYLEQSEAKNDIKKIKEIVTESQEMDKENKSLIFEEEKVFVDEQVEEILNEDDEELEELTIRSKSQLKKAIVKLIRDVREITEFNDLDYRLPIQISVLEKSIEKLNEIVGEIDEEIN